MEDEMKKSILFIIPAVLSLIGCKVPDEQTAVNVLTADNKEAEKEPNVLQIGSSLDAEITSEIENIGIIRITSIDGCDNRNLETGEYVSTVYTYGTFEVIRMYEGELAEGHEYKFCRMGGTIPYDQFLKGLNEQSREKRESLRKETETEKPDYVQQSFDGGIEIKEGKTYLCTIWSMNDPDMLFLGSFAFDCREVDEATLDTEEILILNNETEEWEALSDFLSAIQQ